MPSRILWAARNVQRRAYGTDLEHHDCGEEGVCYPPELGSAVGEICVFDGRGQYHGCDNLAELAIPEFERHTHDRVHPANG